MKITKSQLKQIIKEELGNVIDKQDISKLIKEDVDLRDRTLVEMLAVLKEHTILLQNIANK